MNLNCYGYNYKELNLFCKMGLLYLGIVPDPGRGEGDSGTPRSQ
jgi:hypothetical protein